MMDAPNHCGKVRIVAALQSLLGKKFSSNTNGTSWQLHFC